MNKVLATDLDGTLFYPRQIGRCISKKNVKFLRKWIDAGNKLVLVTSRSAAFCDRLEEEIGRPFDLISCTGAQIRANGKLIRNVTVPNNVAEDVVNKVNRTARPIGILMTTDKYPCAIRDSHRGSTKFLMFFYKIYWWFQFKYREPYHLSNKDFNLETKDGLIYKMMIFFGFGKKKNNFAKEMNKSFREQYPNVEFSWTTIVNEITPKGCTKGESRRDVRESRDDAWRQGAQVLRELPASGAAHRCDKVRRRRGHRESHAREGREEQGRLSVYRGRVRHPLFVWHFVGGLRP